MKNNNLKGDIIMSVGTIVISFAILAVVGTIVGYAYSRHLDKIIKNDY